MTTRGARTESSSRRNDPVSISATYVKDCAEYAKHGLVRAAEAKPLGKWNARENMIEQVMNVAWHVGTAASAYSAYKATVHGCGALGGGRLSTSEVPMVGQVVLAWLGSSSTPQAGKSRSRRYAQFLPTRTQRVELSGLRSGGVMVVRSRPTVIRPHTKRFRHEFARGRPVGAGTSASPPKGIC